MTVLLDETIDRPFGEPPPAPAKPDWKVAFKRARSKFSQDQGTDIAASLTYYSVQSLFPGLIAVISLLNIFGNGKETTTSLVESIGRIIGKDPKELSAITSFIDNVQAAPGGGFALVIGLAGALWSASGYVGAFSRALNRIYSIEEGRSFVKLKVTLLVVTAIELLLIVLVMLALVLSGSVAKEVGNAVGLGDTAVAVWDYAKWPFVAVIVVGIISMLYRATPNVKRARARSILSAGAMIGFLVWVLASLALVAYVGFTKGASYQKTYGALAGVVIFLLWLWITNLAMLFGAELDAELLRTRQLKSGLPAERLILLPARAEEGIEKKTVKDEELVAEAVELRLNSTLAADAVTGRDGPETDAAREFGLAVGPSRHGTVGGASAPVTREPRVQPTNVEDAMSGNSSHDPEQVRASIQRSRTARRDDALIKANAERKARERLAAQQAASKKREAAKQKEEAARQKAREEAIPLADRWDAVAAVRAQFDPEPTVARDEVMTERQARRAQYHAAKVAGAAAPSDRPESESRVGKHRKAEAPPEPTVMREQMDAERAARRARWFADRQQ